MVPSWLASLVWKSRPGRRLRRQARRPRLNAPLRLERLDARELPAALLVGPPAWGVPLAAAVVSVSGAGTVVSQPAGAGLVRLFDAVGPLPSWSSAFFSYRPDGPPASPSSRDEVPVGNNIGVGPARPDGVGPAPTPAPVPAPAQPTTPPPAQATVVLAPAGPSVMPGRPMAPPPSGPTAPKDPPPVGPTPAAPPRLPPVPPPNVAERPAAPPADAAGPQARTAAPPEAAPPARPSAPAAVAAPPARRGEPAAVATTPTVAPRPAPAAVTDGVLLKRFAAGGDQGAFAELVQRHGRSVQAVCARVLGGDADQARDAAQATFLALARRAGALDARESLGGWLYRVAGRMALRVRLDAARRRRLERVVAERRPRAVADGAAAVEAGDLLRVLREELGRLPDRYRVPLELCYLNGRTHAEVADAVGLPRGSVAKRIGEGLDRLRERLALRGGLS